METRSQTPKLIKKGDGTVWRDHVCSCGKIVYKKNLTNNSIELLVGKGSGEYKKQNITDKSIPSQLVISCPHCNVEHIVVGVSEVIYT